MAKCPICQDELSYKSIMVDTVILSGKEISGKRPIRILDFGDITSLVGGWNLAQWEVWCPRCKKSAVLTKADIVFFYLSCILSLVFPGAALWFFVRSKYNLADLENWALIPEGIVSLLICGIGLLCTLNFVWWKLLVQLWSPDKKPVGAARNQEGNGGRVVFYRCLIIALMMIIVGVVIHYGIYYCTILFQNDYKRA